MLLMILVDAVRICHSPKMGVASSTALNAVLILRKMLLVISMNALASVAMWLQISLVINTIHGTSALVHLLMMRNVGSPNAFDTFMIHLQPAFLWVLTMAVVRAMCCLRCDLHLPLGSSVRHLLSVESPSKINAMTLCAKALTAP